MIRPAFGIRACWIPFEALQDASWGERFFHVTDPDGHQLSFAEVLPTGTSPSFVR
jgi:hypothetical protein